MATPLKYFALAGAALAVAACTSETKFNFNQEAGAQIDSGYFGNATMNNMMAQMCSNGGAHGGGGYKGGPVHDPIVVRGATSSGPVFYRDTVQCQGRLNGKYAQVIFREYVESAEPITEAVEIQSAAETAAASE